MWGVSRSGLSFPGQCKLTPSLGGWGRGSSRSKLQLVVRTRGRALPGSPQKTEAFEMGRGWETLGPPMGPRGGHSQGLQKASISPGARCFPPWDLWFLLNKGLSRMVHL